MISEVMQILPMTKEQVINRAIERYHEKVMQNYGRAVDFPTLKHQIVVQQGHRCYYCKRAMKSKDFTLDHLIPQMRGGTDDRDNLVATCKPCNQDKESMTEEEYNEYRRSKKIIHTTPLNPAVI